MLSILIPTYNYSIYNLVQELYKQAIEANVIFEIICLDDASANKDFILENEKINLFANCSYKVLENNIGRCAIRNLLAKKAQYSWLLFLDADTFPANNNFIATYLPYLNREEKVVYGGIKYQEKKPADKELLRWVYGNKREALPVNLRSLHPYKSMLTLNFLISKSVFSKVQFNESIPNLRHDDTLFSYDLSRSGITVQHINNPVYHLGLETSEIFIKKSEEAVVGLKYLLDNNHIDKKYVKLSGIYYKIVNAGLGPILTFFYKATYKTLRNNLKGKNPSLLLFDLYRLGYLSYLNKDR